MDEDVDSISTEHPPWFHAANPDLAMIRGGFVEDAGAVVIGDTPEDFSMAMIYDRTIGFAIWLTLDAVELLSNNWMLAERLRLRATDNAVQPSLATVSMSLAPPQLEPIIRSILAAIDLPELEDESPAEGDWLEMREPVATQDALLSLMLANEVGEVVSLAASEQTGGTVELATGLSAPIPTDPPLTGLGSPAWLVDVATPENQMPRARRVDAGCLAVDSKFELLRSSRAGITFHAASHGFIPSNTVLRSRLARPRLRFPGLADWINARARDGGMVPRLSRPGQNSALVAQRLGGRDAMTGLLAGPLRAGLQYAAQPGGSSRSDFPKEDGVVLHGVRMLTFDAFAEFAVGAGRAEVRSILDQLLVGRLMRRGIVLDCPDCHTPSFVSIDELGQVVNCARCEARNQLTAARWRSPADEPVWFYDLHPALGELLCANGDVSALVAREFKARAARRYFDVEELEFASMETGSTRFEIDLIALIDDELIVVESKSNGSLGSGRKRQRSVIKRFEAAVLLGADAVAFATTGGWSSDTVARVEEIRDTSFQQVRLSWLDGLGS
ncbi:hypothetical protein [Agromyces sp. SYSU T00266]|uniref:hypothetical protein n=1 Tax=Agromyces zhanjiangensis TaxID=3158562 RepID=UPI00339405F3